MIFFLFQRAQTQSLENQKNDDVMIILNNSKYFRPLYKSWWQAADALQTTDLELSEMCLPYRSIWVQDLFPRSRKNSGNIDLREK